MLTKPLPLFHKGSLPHVIFHTRTLKRSIKVHSSKNRKNKKGAKGMSVLYSKGVKLLCNTFTPDITSDKRFLCICTVAAHSQVQQADEAAVDTVQLT